ncbi:hypothetical protein CR513_04163, partial [Mucuna pruriens]
MEIMFLLLDLAMSNFSPLYPYTMFFMFRNWLTTLSLYTCLYKIGIVQNFHHLEFVEPFKCDVCQFSKHHRVTFSPSNNKSLKPFDLIHFDVRGQLIFLMKHKSEVCQIFVDFFRLIKNQFDKSIKRLRSDNGTKFVNLEFSKFLKYNCVVHKLTCVSTPQQNGVAERKNHHLLEVARALLFQMSILNVYWGEVVLIVTHLINKLPTHVLNAIIVSLDVSFVHSHNPHRGKLDPRVVKCVFISYFSNKKGFKCYHPSNHRIFISMDGGSYLEVESVIESLPFPQDVIKSLTFLTQNVQFQVQEVTKPTLVLDVKYHISQFVYANHFFVQHQSFIVVIDAIKTPTSVRESLKDENCVQAMKEEMKALEKNLNWEIINRLKDKRVVGCRWIYNMKCKFDGTLKLVAKGYTQTYGIDYEELFAPIEKMNTKKKVYMEIPPRFYSHNKKNKSQDDHTLFMKHSHDDKLTLLLVYVDDVMRKVGNAI